MIGDSDTPLFTDADMESIRSRKGAIEERVASRKADITHLLKPPEETQVEIVPESDASADLPGEERMEAIRRSVAEDSASVAEDSASANEAAPDGDPNPAPRHAVAQEGNSSE